MVVIPAKAGIQFNRLQYVTIVPGPSLGLGDEWLWFYYLHWQQHPPKPNPTNAAPRPASAPRPKQGRLQNPAVPDRSPAIR